VVLQQKRDGLSMAICACDVKVDGSPMGKVIVGTYAYADLPAGPHQLVASETLFPGDTKRDFTTAPGRTYFFLVKSSARHDSIAGMSDRGAGRRGGGCGCCNVRQRQSWTWRIRSAGRADREDDARGASTGGLDLTSDAE
jgi:hypothetical protein